MRFALRQADDPQLSASHGENQNIQTIGDEADSYGRHFSIALACIGPRRFEVEVGRGGHIYAVLGDIGDILAAVEVNRQALIVYTIK